jgi:mannan endo-1,4-beta-mannosidase
MYHKHESCSINGLSRLPHAWGTLMPIRLRRGAAVVAVVLAGQALVILPTTVLPSAVATAAEAAFTPSDPHASTATVSELDYLGNLPSIGNFVTGYFAGWSSSGGTLTGYEDVSDLYHATGQYPGLVECDYNGGFSSGGDPADVITPSCDAYLEGYWSQGGLVEVGWHPNNPAGGAWDTPLKASQISDLTNSSTATYANWHDQLAQVAAAVNQLGAAGVVAIFRPLMEMNGGGYFWWNGGGWTGPAFVTVWQDMYKYITARLTYHNVLWDWSPDQAGANPTASGHSYYPGAGYVDITGLDVYAANDTNHNYPTASISNYANTLETGKPFAFNEIGTQKTTTSDFSAWPTAIKNCYPKASFFLGWSGDDGPLGQYSTGVRALMNDSSDINLSATHPLAGFEGGRTDGWGGWTSQSGALAGPWSISSADGSDWASQGQYALKGNITNLGQGQQAILNDYGADVDLTGQTELSATVNIAPWTSPATGMTAALYIRTGPANAWFSGPVVPISYSPAGTTLILNLANIPNLNQVNEIGVDFVPSTAGTTGSIYVDNVFVQ